MPNLKRIAAGRRNRQLRGQLTPAGLQRLREAALRHRPWEQSTGPKTPAGRAQSIVNGRRRQVGPISRRQTRAEIAEVVGAIEEVWEEYESLLLLGEAVPPGS